MWDTDNIFLNGPFAPWREEGVAFDLEVEGEIPAGLDGALYRVSSNQHFRPDNPARLHFFDGDGMIHSIFLRDGRATYRNRYVQTEGLKLEMKEGRALFGSFVNGSGRPAVLDGSQPPMKNPANTHITLFNDRLLVFCEAGVPHELRPDTLETVGDYDFHGSVSGPVTAHFKVDNDNGDLLFYGAMGPQMTWYRADRNGVLLDSHKFDMGVPCFVHDYALTPTYAIFVISPQLFAIDEVFKGNPALLWDPEQVPVARFAVLHRVTGEVRWFDADEPFNVSHVYNAYEDGHSIVLDAQRTVGAFGLTKPELENYGQAGNYNDWFTRSLTIATRWELDLVTGTVKERTHTDRNGELPRINDAYTGQKNRFGYFVTQRTKSDWLFEHIAKVDLEQGRTDILTVDGLSVPCEPVFVAREGATAEDDGWLLSVWWDPAADRSEVVIQDAQDFDADPVARIKLNHRLPMGPHGNWIPAADIEAALGSSHT